MSRSRHAPGEIDTNFPPRWVAMFIICEWIHVSESERNEINMIEEELSILLMMHGVPKTMEQEQRLLARALDNLGLEMAAACVRKNKHHPRILKAQNKLIRDYALKA
jgi:hypothetical protein